MQGILPPELDDIHDPSVKEFVKLCISPEKKRPSAAELMQHPFLNVVDENKRTNCAPWQRTISWNPLVQKMYYHPSVGVWSRFVKEEVKPYPEVCRSCHVRLLLTPFQQSGVDTPPVAPGQEVVEPKGSLFGAQTSPEESHVPQPATAPPNSSTGNASAAVELTARVGETKLLLKCTFHNDALGGDPTTVKFPFDLTKDTPEAIARELHECIPLTNANFSAIIQRVGEVGKFAWILCYAACTRVVYSAIGS